MVVMVGRKILLVNIIKLENDMNIPYDRNGNLSANRFCRYFEELQEELEELEESYEYSGGETENILIEIEDIKADIESLEKAYKYLSGEEFLISENNINSYIKELVEDNYRIPQIIENFIDWESLVEDFLPDYQTVEIDGNLFYYL